MSTETQVPRAPSQGVTAPLVTSEALEVTVRQICTFASSSEMKIASAIILEMQNQREQIKRKSDELSEIRKKLEEQEKNQNIAMDQWFIGMQTQKSKFEACEAQVQSLRGTIAKKENELAQSAQKNKNIEDEKKKAQLEHLSEKSKANGLSNDMTSLEKRLKEKDAIINNLRTANLGMTNSLSSEKNKNEELEKEVSSLKSIIRESQARLQKLEGYGFCGHQMDEDSMVDGFSSLWDYATDQMYHIMMQDIDTAALNEIDKHIFQPNYLIPEDSQLRHIMSNLAETDSDKESFCRSMLLSIDQQSQQETIQFRIQHVLRQVSSCVHDLFSGAQYDEFRQRVANIVKKAIDIWLPLQRSQQKYESDFDPLDWNDNEWVTFNLPGENTEKNATAHGIASDTLLTIFPRISQVKDGRRHPLTFVTQLTKTHPLYIQAGQEINSKPNNPTIGRMSLNGTRRKSIAANTDRLRESAFLEKRANRV
ncbi:hypothetical protein N7447_008389 [Penicillium robsamsonii]|uniref:uncharacterized protein n=1 Tax=Penicillium robsamsonii TaxID=1792511 RepID=UPI002547A8D4|nr:uncharacterized protein N7447_008389 [Penicillium robsamsonii]KAJ5816156.1 hypothetical protein N7447_008389 [Penicillium robsamsonii]